MWPKAIICDLDRTLCDNSHRVSHFLKRNWEAYFAGIPDDKPNQWCVQLLKAFALSYTQMGRFQPLAEILFITGRPEKYRIETEAWLCENLLFGTWGLFMRPDISNTGKILGTNEPDTRPTIEIKYEIYEREIKDKYDVLFALEDDEKCAKMYRDECGLTVLKVM